jgi:hypothetical protein
MERRFGYDFSRVRVHTGPTAGQSAREVNAHAYTVGRNIVFSAGRFRPGTTEGRRLIAHELTHTIQQSSHRHVAAAGAAVLQRSPDQPQKSKPSSSLNVLLIREQTAPRLLFAKPFYAGPIELGKLGALQGERFVTESNIIEWAARYIWDLAVTFGSVKEETLVKQLKRGEDNKLHALWRSYAERTLREIYLLYGHATTPLQGAEAPDESRVIVVYPRNNPFSGSEPSRSYWAKYLATNWTMVNERLDQKVTDLLVKKIGKALHSPLIPAGSLLVSDPARITQIEETPEMGKVQLGRWNKTAEVGFEWMGKRMKSIGSHGIDFELIDHEGIYFNIGRVDFRNTDPLMGKVVSDVAAATKGTMVIGQFIKGFLNGLASPVVMVLDTAAKLIDMSTMAVSAFGKGTGWYDIGYTCLSSTCQNYEDCLKANKSTAQCQSDILQQAMEEATIIIPLYRQGKDCLDGDPEACGGIAAMALGLVEGGAGMVTRVRSGRGAFGRTRSGKPMAKFEFEETVIREAIGRPRPGDPKLAKALEKPKPPEKIAPPPPTKREPPAKPLKPVEQVQGLKAAIDKAANRLKIKPEQLHAEVNQIRKDATDPSKVHRPKDARYDAEMKTSVKGEEHTFDRERGTSFWCRYSSDPPGCGVPVGPEVDKAVDVSLRQSGGKAATEKAAPTAKLEPPVSPKEPPKAAKETPAAIPEQRLQPVPKDVLAAEAQLKAESAKRIENLGQEYVVNKQQIDKLKKDIKVWQQVSNDLRREANSARVNKRTTPRGQELIKKLATDEDKKRMAQERGSGKSEAAIQETELLRQAKVSDAMVAKLEKEAASPTRRNAAIETEIIKLRGIISIPEKAGGSHKVVSAKTRKGQSQSNHMPAKDAYLDRIPLTEGEGPAIWMTEADHMKTESWGSSDKAKAWRQKQSELIEQGRYMEALEMDIMDIRKKFPDGRYENGIKQALEYAKGLDPSKLKPKPGGKTPKKQ